MLNYDYLMKLTKFYIKTMEYITSFDINLFVFTFHTFLIGQYLLELLKS